MLRYIPRLSKHAQEAMNPLYLKLGGGLLALLLISGLWWSISNAYDKAAQLEVVKDELVKVKEEKAAFQESAIKTAKLLAKNEERLDVILKERPKAEVVYREAIKSDPDCAAWAREPIRCPVDWVSEP